MTVNLPDRLSESPSSPSLAIGSPFCIALPLLHLFPVILTWVKCRTLGIKGGHTLYCEGQQEEQTDVMAWLASIHRQTICCLRLVRSVVMAAVEPRTFKTFCNLYQLKYTTDAFKRDRQRCTSKQGINHDGGYWTIMPARKLYNDYHQGYFLILELEQLICEYLLPEQVNCQDFSSLSCRTACVAVFMYKKIRQM